EHMLAGRARGLGMTRGRAPQLPDIPSMEEIGYASVDSASEMGLIVPASTPAPIVERLQQVAANTVKDPAFSQSLLERGFQPIGSTTEEFRSHVDREIEKWIRIIAAGTFNTEELRRQPARSFASGGDGDPLHLDHHLGLGEAL